jgi:hypothetical protein
MVVQITTDFLPVPQVHSALCPGVTGFHQLCFCVSVRRCSAVLATQLCLSVPLSESTLHAGNPHVIYLMSREQRKRTGRANMSAFLERIC